jgi:hypothetical protein
VVLRALQPFIGEDASRPWCGSIKVVGNHAYATNNIVLVQAPLAFPGSFALPVYAVEELLRIGSEPVGYALEDNAVTFYLPGDIWLRATLLENGWPDAAAALSAVHQGAKLRKVPPGLRAAVERLVPFCPNPKLPMVRMADGAVQTEDGAMSATVGGFAGLGGTYRAEPLLAVLAVAEKVDWTAAPRVPWSGGGLLGVLMGVA